MAPRKKDDKSQLKRGRGTVGEEDQDSKKPRRSERLSGVAEHGHNTPVSQKQHLPSPVTHQESEASEAYKEATATPPEGRPSQIPHRSSEYPRSPELPPPFSSPPNDTQVFSQFVQPQETHSHEVVDEAAEGVWGYLLPLDTKYGSSLVLRKRTACPMPDNGSGLDEAKTPNGKSFKKEEEAYENTKLKGIASGGYLIGRHPECDLIIGELMVSNRHCLLFTENKGGDNVAIVEDLSSNGTFVNEHIVGRNRRRELKEGDEITIMDKARFVFRYPKVREATAFSQQYTLLEKLGKGHFAEVFLCIEKSTGIRYAVKIFSKSSGPEEKTKTEGLQQEIAVLMGVSHPNMLCLKDTFNERKAVYVVLELAAEGELFNWIVLKQKLTEAETRKIFIQLFQGVKYLHERNIVHRDIKPENILLTDKNLSLKLADFGLAKIIGEESFTTSLCGTPSYVAPEILEDTRNRRYTRAVDIWSLGVVLYICLCGFPPFSDELYSAENPYTLTEQIREGRFDYPSPYWDSVGDPALDLIDRMLTVDVNRRYTIDQCLEHPWTTAKSNGPNLTDSTDGIVDRIAGLDFSKRKVVRERTLLSTINDVKITRIINVNANRDPVKVFSKNQGGEKKVNKSFEKKEVGPAANRRPEEFIEMGGKGDQILFGDDQASKYTKNS